MQNLGSAGAHQEWRLLDSIVPDRDDQIGALDRIMDIVARRQRRGAHVEPGSAGGGALAHLRTALAHLRTEERDLQTPHEIRQGLRQARPARGCTQHHQGTLGLADQSGRAIQRRSIGDRQCDRVGRHWQNLRRLLCRDILRQFEMDRARSLLPRDPESLSHDCGDRRRADDLMRHLGQRRHRRDDVDDLKARLLAAEDTFLAGYHDHRHRAELGISRTRRQIERAGPQRRKADARLARQPSVCGCHESRRLFVAGRDELDRRAPQRFDNVEIFFSGHPKDLLYTLVLKCRYEQLSPVHRIRSLSFDVSVGVRSECRALKSNIELLDFNHTN